ncbi:MAG: hypothetical protein NC399_01325 [Muribaculum sp.]|nr:hypothetical protein [Muribaculum sp.]
MDGQNFQNEQNEQNTQNVYTQGTTGNYQDNTSQYGGSMYTAPVVEEQSNTTPGMSIAGLVMGIVSIVLTCCCGGGIIFAIAGLIMSIVGNKQKQTGVGTAGLVCSIIGMVLNVFSLIYWILAGGVAMLDM